MQGNIKGVGILDCRNGKKLSGFISKEKEDRVLLSCKNGVAAGAIAKTHGAAGTCNLNAFHQISSGTVVDRATDFYLSRSLDAKCKKKDIVAGLFQF